MFLSFAFLWHSIFRKILKRFYCMCINVLSECICVSHVCLVPMEAWEGSWVPWDWNDSWISSPYVDTRNPTLVLCKLLGHLSSVLGTHILLIKFFCGSVFTLVLSFQTYLNAVVITNASQDFLCYFTNSAPNYFKMHFVKFYKKFF